DQVEVRTHAQIALDVPPLAEVLLVRSALDGLARRDRLQAEELEDPVQNAGGGAGKLLVRKDGHAGGVRAVGCEQRVATEPVLEHPVVATGPAPPSGGDRDGNRVTDDDDERRAGEKSLQEARLEQVRRRLLEQDAAGGVPVRRPLLEQLV